VVFIGFAFLDVRVGVGVLAAVVFDDFLQESIFVDFEVLVSDRAERDDRVARTADSA